MKNLLLLGLVLTGLLLAETATAASTATVAATTGEKASPNRHRRQMQRLHRQSLVRVKQSKRSR